MKEGEGYLAQDGVLGIKFLLKILRYYFITLLCIYYCQNVVIKLRAKN